MGKLSLRKAWWPFQSQVNSGEETRAWSLRSKLRCLTTVSGQFTALLLPVLECVRDQVTDFYVLFWSFSSFPVPEHFLNLLFAQAAAGELSRLSSQSPGVSSLKSFPSPYSNSSTLLRSWMANPGLICPSWWSLSWDCLELSQGKPCGRSFEIRSGRGLGQPGSNETCRRLFFWVLPLFPFGSSAFLWRYKILCDNIWFLSFPGY